MHWETDPLDESCLQAVRLVFAPGEMWNLRWEEWVLGDGEGRVRVGNEVGREGGEGSWV